MKKTISIAFMCFVGVPAIAQECISIENDLDRLACYDKQNGRTLATSVENSPETAWVVRTDKSEFKDTTDVYLSLTSENPLHCRNYGTPVKAQLFLRCSENTTSMFLATDCHLASGHRGYGQVEYRFDDRAAGEKGFDASTDNSALGLWSGGKAIPMIKQMIGADRAIFRFTPYGQSPVTAKFQISGLEEVIKPLRKECGW